jgi:hypothetical protein
MRKLMLLLAAIAICGVSAPLALCQTYRPSTYRNLGQILTNNPTYAYDGNLTTYAGLTGVYVTPGGSSETECAWSGFPSYTSTGTLTLNVSFAIPSISNGLVVIDIYQGGPPGGLQEQLVYSSVMSETTVQWTVPAGTNLDTIQIWVQAKGLSPSGGATTDVYEIWIQ